MHTLKLQLVEDIVANSDKTNSGHFTYKVSNKRRWYCHGQWCWSNDKSNNV